MSLTQEPEKTRANFRRAAELLGNSGSSRFAIPRLWLLLYSKTVLACNVAMVKKNDISTGFRADDPRIHLPFHLSGRYVLITGAAFENGVEYVTALAHARAGASVVTLLD